MPVSKNTEPRYGALSDADVSIWRSTKKFHCLVSWTLSPATPTAAALLFELVESMRKLPAPSVLSTPVTDPVLLSPMTPPPSSQRFIGGNSDGGEQLAGNGGL